MLSTTIKFPNFVLLSWLKSIVLNLTVIYQILEVFLKWNIMIFHHDSIIVKTSLLGWFSSLSRKIFKLNGKGHKPSRAELKIVQLKPWLKLARLWFITNT